MNAIFETVCKRISALVKRQADSVKSETGLFPKVCFFAYPALGRNIHTYMIGNRIGRGIR